MYIYSKCKKYSHRENIKKKYLKKINIIHREMSHRIDVESTSIQ